MQFYKFKLFNVITNFDKNMDAPMEPVAYATQLLTAAPPSCQQPLNKYLDAYQRRLFHPLALAALELARRDEFAAALPDFFRHCILPIHDRIDPARLVDIASAACTAILDAASPDTATAVAAQASSLMNDVAQKLAPPRPHALPQHIRALALAVSYVLQQPNEVPLQEARERLHECEAHLNSLGAGHGALGGVPADVHAAFYRASAQVSRRTRNWDAFYASGMLYLACADLPTMSVTEKCDWVIALCIAAIAAKGIYVFGDLLTHPVMKEVEPVLTKQNDWRLALAKAMNAGSLAAFTKLSVHFKNEPAFLNKQDFLLDKVRLIAIMESAFERTFSTASNSVVDDPEDAEMTSSEASRRIPLQQLASKIHVSVDQVEPIVMRALARDLIRGSIDQVDEVVVITWVRPRYLDVKQLKVLRHRLSAWEARVRAVERSMHVQGKSEIPVADDSGANFVGMKQTSHNPLAVA